MKKLYFFSLTLFSLFAAAQHRADKWYFGTLAGIDFTGGTATAISGGMVNTPEGCSSMSDNLTGALMFYTDGISVWNQMHSVMPNGSGLLGSNSSTQAALIVPQPGSNTLYYIFTTDEIGGPDGLRYSIVDMTLQGGLGDVTVRNNLLLQNVTEKLTAVQDAASGDYWIVAHKWGNNDFYAYKLSATGLSAPVVSSAGINHDSSAIQNTYGQMKFNGCGSKIACAVGYKDTIEIFDFNSATGAVSNPFTIPMSEHVYGIEFSADGSKFYAGQYGTGQTLFQFDLSLATPSAILASKTPLSVTQDIYGLQLGPDKKIYVVKSFQQWLGVINNPDTAGASCNYVDFGLDLDPNFMGVMASLTLPGFVQSFLNTGENCLVTSTGPAGSPAEAVVFPNPSASHFSIRANAAAVDVIIYNGIGKVIDKFSADGNQVLTFGHDYAPGIYFARFSDSRTVIRFIKTAGE